MKATTLSLMRLEKETKPFLLFVTEANHSERENTDQASVVGNLCATD